MRILALAMATILAVVCLAACGGDGEEEEQAPTAMSYEIVDREDDSFGGVIRVVFRVRLEEATEAQLRAIAEEVIEKETEAQPVNAVSLLFYLPDTDTEGPYTAGMADWAPDGKWRNADQVEAGDYSTHKLVVEVVAPAAAPSEEDTPTAAPSEAGLAPGSLSSLNSYRYSMKMELEGLESLLTEQMAALPGQDPTAMAESLEMEISGAFVAPDKAESRMRISGLDDELALTVIGDQQWVQFGDLAIGPIQAMGDVSELDFALMIWEEFSGEAGGLSCASEKKETVNDVPSRYCGIDQATFEQLSSLFGGTEEMGDIDEMSLDMWLAEDGGWPVRLRVHVAGTDETGQEFDAKLELDVTDVNKKIEIKPPS